jgi:hypothetical protein
MGVCSQRHDPAALLVLVGLSSQLRHIRMVAHHALRTAEMVFT